MRSLFIKIFLWFWLAMILVAGAAVVTLHVHLDPEEEGLRKLANNFKDPAAYVAIETLEESGPQALRRHLERWNRYSGFRGYVFDDSGKEVSGQETPSEVVEVAAKARQTSQAAVHRTDTFMYMASLIPGMSGKIYIFVSGLPNRPLDADRPPVALGGGPEDGPPPRPGPGRLGPGRPGPEKFGPGDLGPDEFGPNEQGPGERGPRSGLGPGEGRPPFPMGGGPIRFLLSQPRIIVLILTAVVLMSGIVCYGLARYLAGPLGRLRASARQLADGNLAVRVGDAVQNRRDEMGDLGRDFDFMAERVESLVTSQRRLLRDMSHELRSPLARLNVALGLGRQRTGPEISANLDRIELEAQRLNELIGQLLTLARLEGGTKVEKETTIDLAAVVREVVADAEFEADSCKRQIRLLACDECTVTGTLELLRSAIENIVRNGIRYAPEDTDIEISLRREQQDGREQAVIQVRDHGPGVPEEVISDIFQPFCRVGDDRDRNTGGVGLGLAIAQQAVRLHGGTISAANAPGGGLIVEIKLPLSSNNA